jgi:hypothetical protein
MINIVWVLTNGCYEVSSLYHFLCITTSGVGYCCSGNVPSNYMSVSYIQTVNINFINLFMTPIGTISVPFTGNYNGQNYELQNWQSNQATGNQGIFGYCYNITTSTIKNINITGVTKVVGTTNTGILCGYASCKITNVITNFSLGSSVTATGNYTGGLIGFTDCLTLEQVRMRGYLTISGIANVGGMIGNVSAAAGSSFIRDLILSIIGNITCTGTNLGGIIGYTTSIGNNYYGLINEIFGNLISGTTYCGGIIGTSSAGIIACINRMKGNITATSAGGIVATSTGTIEDCINIMEGDMGTTASGIGLTTSTLKRNVVAIKGNLSYIINNAAGTSTNNVFSNRFGMTVANVSATTATNATKVTLDSYPTTELTTAGYITTWNSLKYIPVWSYTYTDILNVSRTLTSDTTYMPTITWVLNGDGLSYEVSSIEHLKCLAGMGVGYNIAGNPPSTYLTATYIQTVNIDCTPYIGFMQPIGLSNVYPFTGNYDGQNYEIQNWQNDQTTILTYQGIFSSINNTSSIIKNLKITGVTKVKGGGNVGILCGNIDNGKINNINVDLALNSIVTSSGTGIGGLIGRTAGTVYIEKISMKGYFLLVSTGSYTGGIVGLINNNCYIRDVILSTIGNFSGSTSTGGIIGYTVSTVSIYGLINEMQGNITNSGINTGGIVGNSTCPGIYSCINKMKGKITGVSYVGGIVGNSTQAIEDNMNLMEGNMVWTTITNCGGIGYTSMANPSIKRNVLAMKGNAPSTISNTISATTNVLNNVFSNRFGMTINGAVLVTTSATNGTYVTLDSYPTTELTTSGYINTWDSQKFIPVSSYTYTDVLSASKTILSSDTNNSLVYIAWVLNGDGISYEVSSINHLRCIASMGTGFNVTGSIPPNYFTASYIQTVNIDCTGYTMVPIGGVPLGTIACQFTGNYNGQNYEIQNWQNDQTVVSSYQGIFGYINNASSIIKNITITGITKIYGSGYSGILSGYAKCKINNINLNLSPYSIVTSTSSHTGGIIGYLDTPSYVEKIRVNGYLNITGTLNVGGIIGNVVTTNTIRDILISTFGNIIGSSTAIGGIIGLCGSTVTTFGVINQIQGNITGTNYIGGIIGDTTSAIYATVNKMIGNITGTTYVGGIVGRSTQAIEDNMNLMEGNMVWTTITNCGGIGYTSMASPSIKRNVTATCGIVPSTISNTISVTTNVANNVFSNKFVMSVNGTSAASIANSALNGTLVALSSYPTTELTTTGYIKTWDSVRYVPIWSYTYANIFSNSQTVTSDINLFPSITWTLTNSKYEVSSIEHLICIATYGKRHNCSGNIPSNYYSASYIQTINIDCSNKIMYPIGQLPLINGALSFTGSYNGQNYEIQNWQNDQISTALNYQGMFGYMTAGTCENIKITGITKVKGIAFVGLLNTLISGVCIIRNISANLSSGSLISTSGSSTGGLIGSAILSAGGDIYNLSISGMINITSTSSSVGGIIGVSQGSSVQFKLLTNSIIGNITGTTLIGGIIGQATTALIGVNLNMIGNITGSSTYVGGIVGQTTAASIGSYNWFNKMTGTIQGSNNVGGLCGQKVALSTIKNAVCVMTGNILATIASGKIGGGIGDVTGGTNNNELENILIAINGNINTNILSTSLTIKPNYIYYSNIFGMTINNSIILSDYLYYNSANYVTETLLDLIPNFNNSTSTLKSFNNSTKIPFFDYTYQSINMKPYSNIPDYASLTLGTITFDTNSGYNTANASWSAITNATHYRLLLGSDNMTEYIIVSSTISLSASITQIECNTSNSIALYYSIDNGSTFIDSSTRYYFTTTNVTGINVNITPLTTSSFSINWSSLNNSYYYKLLTTEDNKPKITQITPTQNLSGNITGLTLSKNHIIQLLVSLDNTNFYQIYKGVYYTGPITIWTLNTDGISYEISSLEHFRCIGANGIGYAINIGGCPTNFMTENYIQTVNINCTSYASSMIPIGSLAYQFTGNYDGQNYEIQNWQNNQSSTSDYQGIFGYINNSSSIIKNISITGLTKVKGANNCGVLSGYFVGKVNNINLNLITASVINGTSNLGGLIGQVNTISYIEKIVFKGYITITGTAGNVGGIIGNILGTDISYIRNIILSTIGNISGTTSIGGFIGVSNTSTSMYGLINEIQGNITGTGAYIGGIIGLTSSDTIACMNRMKGNITGLTYVGGIIGLSTGALEDNINVMEGNIVWTTITNCGGIGYTSKANPSIKRNITAIKGNAPSTIANTISSTTNVANNVFSNRFGMTIASAVLVTTSATNGTYITLYSYPTTELTTSGLINTWDSTRFIPYWSYTYTDIFSVSQTISSTTTYYPDTNITWVLNNGNYEVSSLYHLLCMSSNGYRFVASGNPPQDYLTAFYIQTTNIDCTLFAGLMTPIGSLNYNFKGSYDGQNYEIQNWQNNQSSTSDYQGIFGVIANTPYINQNINITGLTKVKGNNNCGILAGYYSTGKIYNINLNLSLNSVVNGVSYVGSISGQFNNIFLYKSRVKGYLTITATTGNTGGIVGNMVAGCYLKDIILSTVGNITCPTNTGGIIGSNGTNTTTTYGLINEIQGNIAGTTANIGGIIGNTVSGVYACTNRMKGNITGGTYVGGIVGVSTAAIEDNINVMEGNIVWTTITNCGGIGYTSMASPSIKRNVLAMKGNAPSTIANTISATTNVANNVFSNRFGMTIASAVLVTTSVTNGTNVTLDSYPTTELTTSGFINTWDAGKFIPVWSYTYTDFSSVSQTLISTTTNYPDINITWVLTNGRYEVSTIDHLRCIAALGTRYNCSGDIPSNYLTASYIQTANIDCIMYPALMVSIGSLNYQFTGSYNGQNYEIQNWQNNQSNTIDYQGLFGYISGTPVIENIKMTGVLKIKGGSYCGGLIGIIGSGGGIARNIYINYGSTSALSGVNNIGGAIGSIIIGTCENIIVTGTITVTATGTSSGGVIGMTNGINIIKNLQSSITGNITGTANIGGVIGYCTSSTLNNSIEGLVNNNIGNITSSGGYAGGIIGLIDIYSGNSILSSCWNRMTGTIQATTYAGGIVGSSIIQIQDSINAMIGSITGTTTATTCGGIGYCTTFKYNRNIIAVQGNIPNILINSSLISSTTNITNNVFSNRYGMTVNNISVIQTTTNVVLVDLIKFPTTELTTNGSIKYWSNAYSLPYWTYTYTGTNTITKTIQPIIDINVNWVLSNGKYLVSSINHLRCIATRGVGYYTTGNIPDDYNYVNYSQTTDIDCSNYVMNSIGTSSVPFRGCYDGQNYEIQNWQNDQFTTTANQGLFGYITTNNLNSTIDGSNKPIIENIKMTGIIKVKGAGAVGSIIGYLQCNGYIVRNINIVFSTNSIINSTNAFCGGVIGNTVGVQNIDFVDYGYGYIENIKVSGNITISNTGSHTGGVIGNVNISYIKDIVSTITGNIIGTTYVGGIIGNATSSTTYIYIVEIPVISSLINKMTGNITGSLNYVGGITGAVNFTIEHCINNMVGNITGTTGVGGIIGNASSSIVQDCINIMTGNIISTTNTLTSGGIGHNTVGKYYRNLLSMNGSTPNLFTGTIPSNNIYSIDNIFSNRFGMLVNGLTKTTDINFNSILLDLSSFPANISDKNITKMWDSTTNIPYPVYTYLSTDLVQRTNRLIDNGITYQSIQISNLTTTNQFGNVILTWNAISGYSYYRIIINPENTGDVTIESSTTNLTTTINNLECGMNYIASIYISNDNNTFIDSGLRVKFITTDCSIFDKNTVSQTSLSPTWTSVSGITNYRVKIKGINIAETIVIDSTTNLTGSISGLTTLTYYILTLEGSSDNITFTRLASQQSHWTLVNFITWTMLNGRYCVSSIKHLLALISTLYYPTTSVYPSDYTIASYIQTADIDCSGYVMVPIPPFKGRYDGQNYEIQNWQNDPATTGSLQGLFGSVSNNNTSSKFDGSNKPIIENIKMTGIIKVKGNSSIGSVIGSINCMGYIVRNINVIFATGSIINNAGSNTGGVIGQVNANINPTFSDFIGTNGYGYVENIRVSGDVTITSTNTYVGGVFGSTTCTYIRDVVSTINGNINGSSQVGGIIGYNNAISSYSFVKATILSSLINKMTGNITGSSNFIGGITGQTNGGIIEHCINKMVGNITGTTYIGGINGLSDNIVQDCINIMTGDIISITNTLTSGGIGYNNYGKYYRNLLAMNGSTPNLMSGTAPVYTYYLNDNVFSNRFGMLVNGLTKTIDIDFNSILLDLSLFPANISDKNITKMWDSATNIPYPVYTYLSTDLVQRTNRLIDNGITYQSIQISNLTTTNQFGNVTLTWNAISGYSYYRIIINPENTGDVTIESSTTNLTITINNLECGMNYIASIYISNDNNTFIDSGLRVKFITTDCSIFDKNPVSQTSLSPIWTSVSGITNYRVKIKGINIAETIIIDSTTNLTGSISGLTTLTYYILTLEGSSDNITFTRLSSQQSHWTYANFITWTMLNGKYCVSSVKHLQSMAVTNSTLYYPTTSIYPPDYTTASYIQTADIDCSGYVMVSIGSVSYQFKGNYDGQNYEIQNWQNDQASTAQYQGLFGIFNITTNQSDGTYKIGSYMPIIENIKMTGIIKVKGSGYVGCLIGGMTCVGCIIRNITIIFSPTSIINSTGNLTGGLIGSCAGNSTFKTNYGYGYIENIRVYGNVTITGTTTVGGVSGNCSYCTIRDIIFSPICNITGTTNIGGIIGNISNTISYPLQGYPTVNGLINNMTGNMIGTTSIGGIIGSISCLLESCFNNMTGNITGTTNVGGIIGNSTNVIQDCINKMNGNIISTTNIVTTGVIGHTTVGKYFRNVLEMTGNTSNLLSGTLLKNVTDYSSNNVYSNRFGMTINTSNLLSDNLVTKVSLDSFPLTELTTNGSIKYFNDSLYTPYWINNYKNTKSINANINMYSNLTPIDLTPTGPSINTINVNWIFNNNYYEISSDNHLITLIQGGLLPLSTDINTVYNNTGIIPSNWLSASYKQTSNINLNNINLCSLQSTSSNFTGEYNGQNYEIQNLLYSNKGNNSNCGLFKNINNAIIRNINITGSLNIYGNNSNDRGTISYGGLVHSAGNNNLIENCKIIGSGFINTNSNISLICNNMTGNNNIINKCYTSYTGTINTNCSNNPSGIILGKSLYTNNYVLFSTNENNGNNYLGTNCGGIIGSTATVFGCINKSVGNLDGINCGGMAGNGKIIYCINDVTGNIGDNSVNVAGITISGEVSYSINCMKGNLNSNSGYGISKDGKVTNSLNYMYGNVYDAIGGNILTSSNNYCALQGQVYNTHNTSYKQYYTTLNYGLSNNIAHIPIRNDVWNLYTLNNYITYFEDIDLPLLQNNLSIKINNSNYYGPASNWEISFPNNSIFSEFKYQYDITTQKYKLYKKLLNNSIVNIVPIIADGSSSNTVPAYLLSLVGNSNKTDYKTSLTNLIATNSNIKTLEEASIYTTLSNQKQINNNYYDFLDLTTSINSYKEIYKPAIKNILKTEIIDKTIIKNLDNSSLFNTVIKERNVDKLCVKSNTILESSEVNSLFSNQNDLLLLDDGVYNINLNGPIMTIDMTNTSTTNNLNLSFNGSNYTLDSTNNYVEIEYEPNVWKRIQITSLGSASIEAINLTNLTLTQDNLNNYLITNEDDFICLANEGYGYHVTNAPSNYMTANYLQTVDLNFAVRSNIMIEGNFKGIYNGNSKVINNLNYNTDTTNYSLFNIVENGTIKNVTLSNDLNVSGYNNFGGIVYNASNNCLIDNCKILSSGSININGSLGLICNQTNGSNIIIKNCLTEYIGNINSSNNCGSILSSGSGTNNCYVLHCTNLNNGLENHSGLYNGGLVGKDATVFGCLNNKFGNWSASNGGGIIGSGTAIACINSIKGDLSNVSIGGIINSGSASYCINNMIGNIYGSISGGISASNGTVINCLNIMKGNIDGYAIGNILGSNNICGMYGKPNQQEFLNTNYGLSNYNLDNSISQLSLININNIQNYLPNNSYLNYLANSYDFKLPYLKSDLNYNGYINNATNWHTLYPNIVDNYFNLYAVRYTDNELVKLKTTNFINLNLITEIFNYTGKLFTWDFSWSNSDFPVTNINVGIGTNITPKTFNVGGDINYSGNLYNSNNELISLDSWNINNTNYYYNNGYIGINKTIPNYLLDVNGDIRATNYLTISDSRLKENILNEELGLDFINNLQPKKFQYRHCACSRTTANIIHGLIAQELNNNDFIETDINGYYSIKTTDLIAPIVKAIQELSSKI